MALGSTIAFGGFVGGLFAAAKGELEELVVVAVDAELPLLDAADEDNGLDAVLVGVAAPEVPVVEEPPAPSGAAVPELPDPKLPALPALIAD